jgi:hypothetical protein
MKLADYLKKGRRDFPPRGTVGVETDWLDVGASVEVTTGALWAGDPYVCNAEDGCVVKVPAGTYVLQAKGMEFAGRRRVSRLRVVREGVDNAAPGKRVGETLTDVGLMAVCDIGALDEAVGGDYDAFQEGITAHDFKDWGVVRFTVKKPITIAYVASGFGDCDAPVWELRAKGRRGRVGMELEFIPPGYAFSLEFEG